MKETSAEVLSEPHPTAQPIEAFLEANTDDDLSGVFALYDQDSILFIGQSTDVVGRLRQIQSSEGWNRFNLRDVSVWPIDDAHDALARRCLLVTRHRPWLNAHFMHQPIATALF